MQNNQETERREASRGFLCFSLATHSFYVLTLAVCVCVCVYVCVCSGCRLADCCDTTESVTNQLEKHQRDVPNVFLWQGWTRAHWAVPLAGELAGGLDECAAGFPSATGAWLELRAYKFQPGEEEAAGVCVGVCVCVCVCVLIHVKEQEPEETAVHLLHFTLAMYRLIDYTLTQTNKMIRARTHTHMGIWRKKETHVLRGSFMYSLMVI